MTKGPRRSELSANNTNTALSETETVNNEDIESREYHGMNKPRLPLVFNTIIPQRVNYIILK